MNPLNADDLSNVSLTEPVSLSSTQGLVDFLPGSYLGKLGLFQAPNLIELVVDAYKVHAHTRVSARAHTVDSVG